MAQPCPIVSLFLGSSRLPSPNVFGGREITKIKNKRNSRAYTKKKVLRYPIKHFSILFQWESFFLIPLVYSSFPGLLIPVYVSRIPASTEITFRF